MPTLTRSSTSLSNEVAIYASKAVKDVNFAIGVTREKYITNIVGQELIYKEKEIEAQRYVAASPEPNTVPGWEAEYPFVSAEVGSTAATPLEVANTYLTMAAQWRMVGSALEQLRIGTITACENATTKAEVDAARAAFNGQLAAF